MSNMCHILYCFVVNVFNVVRVKSFVVFLNIVLLIVLFFFLFRISFYDFIINWVIFDFVLFRISIIIIFILHVYLLSSILLGPRSICLMSEILLFWI